jgi:feruloyl esterase
MFRAGFLVFMLAFAASPSSAATCESVSSRSLPHATVTTATTVAAGAFAPPQPGRGGRGGNPYTNLPAFCRVAATLKPVTESDIRMEVWLPSAGWNGKLQVVGNGAYAGTISYPAMATALSAGYAAASTDTGHTGPSSNTFANEAALVDFAHRAIHETTVAAKAIVDGFYGSAPKLSYFTGCSTGGRQALTAAQRYPGDFDGIVAGAPAAFTSKQAFGQIWIYQATAEPAAALPRETLQLVNDAVMNACDARDGVKDGVLENPTACSFDPATLVCRGGQTASCITAPQANAVRKIWEGAQHTRTGAPVYVGFERGSELGWNPEPVGYAVDYFKYLVFKNPGWDPKTLNFDSDLAQADRAANKVFDATNANVEPFTSRGGKLLMYHGWNDPGIPPRYTVSYYDAVQTQTKGAQDAVRLFMVPGMNHCGGGVGTSTFDMAAALDRWVTTGKPPASIPASRTRDGVVDRTRPLCPYPQQAVYNGTGGVDDAASFSCAVR